MPAGAGIDTGIDGYAKATPVVDDPTVTSIRFHEGKRGVESLSFPSPRAVSRAYLYLNVPTDGAFT
jgi:hypothetical protein